MDRGSGGDSFLVRSLPDLNTKVVYTVEDAEGNTIEGISELICDNAGKELELCRKYVETFLMDEKRAVLPV